MECRFQPVSGQAQTYEGAINTVGLDLGFSEGGVLAWGVFGPANGVPDGALAGEYVGASGDVGFGPGVGANVLVGGSNRSVGLAAGFVGGLCGCQCGGRPVTTKIASGPALEGSA